MSASDIKSTFRQRLHTPPAESAAAEAPSEPVGGGSAPAESAASDPIDAAIERAESDKISGGEPVEAAAPAEVPSDPAPAEPVGDVSVSEESWNHAVELAGSDDPRKIAEALVRINKSDANIGRENADLKRKLADAEARLATSTPATPATSEAGKQTPAPAAAAAGAPPLAPPPAPDSDEAVNARVIETLKQDRDVQSWFETHRSYQAQGERNTARLRQIHSVDENGVQGGQLLEVIADFRDLASKIPEVAKRYGIKESRIQLDEVQLEEARRQFAQVEHEYNMLRNEKSRLELENATLALRDGQLETQYDQRKKHYQTEIRKTHESQRTQSESDQAWDGKVQEFGKSFSVTFDSVMKENNITDPDVVADIFNQSLNVAEKDINQAIALEEDTRGYITRFAKREIDKADRLYRERQRDNGKKKLNDARPQAPPGQAAVAKSPSAPTIDPKTFFRQKLKRARERGASA